MPGYPVSEPGVHKGVRSQKWQYALGSITVGTATTATATSSSVVVNKPTVVDNTLLIASIACASGSINSTPSGWAALPGTSSGSGTGYVFALYYKFIASAAGEGATTYTWGLSGSAKNSGIIVPFYGVHTSSQFDANTNTQNLTTTTVTGTFNTSYTTLRAGGLLIGGMIAGTDGGTSLDPPSGWTEITEVASVQNAIGYQTASLDTGFNASAQPAYVRHDAGTAAHAWAIALRVDNQFTWTKPAWARRVRVITVHAGAGGGGSCKAATNANRFGGGGGAAGYRGEFIADAPTLPATLTVTVGRGGAGGGRATVNTTNGTSGQSIELSTVLGSGIASLTADGSVGGGGGGGSTAGGSAGSTTNSLSWTTREVGGNGGAGSASAAGGTSAATGGPPSGGGAGGGFNNSNTAFDPGGAGATGIVTTATVTNVGTSGTSGSSTADLTGVFGGSGGTGGQANGAGDAGNGGAGGFPGGGGGGGGAAVNSTGNAGYGGRGGHGCVTITAEG